ncbi:glycosyltransferase family 4 protein [Gaetbulibacter sp. PBL-D1]|uniref:glycosyltransferase family 4 protein n=1 Tax=Gaetbulibacter sp. PBL-D1 TaxID=3422594 RepID=UPI003D2ECED9
MKNVLYIGNNLRGNHRNPSYITVLGPLLEREGYSVRYASSKANIVLRLLEMLYAVIKHRKRTDCVLIDTYSTLNFYYAFAVSQLCRLLKLDYVPILHGGNLPKRLHRTPKLSDMIFNHAKQNVSPSYYLYERFKVHGMANLTFIPNVISIDNYPFKERSYTTIKLLWVRSFSVLYNPELAVRVLKTLLDKGYKASLCMVGPDSDGTLVNVKALASTLGVEVTFTGKLSKAAWTQLSQDYNCFINTTNFDNTPVSVIEAMALGLPIVSTNVGGMPYLIQHQQEGLLVAPESVEAMVEAILYLFEHATEREHMIANARAVAESFDWNRVKQLWKEVFE